MATKYTKNADGTVTSTFNVDAPNPTTQAPIQPQQGTTYTQNADGTVTSTFNTPVQPAQPVEKPQQTGTTYKQNADGTVTSTFNQPTQTVQNQNQITDWKNLTDDQKTLDNLSKLVNNRYNTQSTINGQNVNATVDGRNYGWYLDEGKNPIKNDLGPAENQSQNAPTGLIFDRNSDWSALQPNQKTINNLQKLIEARYGTLAEVEGDRVVADIGGKMYQWTLDQNGNPVKTEVPADNTQFNSGEILEQLKANPNLDLSTYDPTQAAIAKNNFTKIQNFDGMNSDQLNESLQSGALLVGTTVRNNLNPQQRQIVDMANTLNMIKGIFLDPLLINENAEKNILANAGPLAQALKDNYLSTAEVDEITITPEMKQMKDNADFWGDEMNRLRTNYEYLEDDIEEELKGQNATASYRDRYMAKEGKALYRALTTAQRNYQMYYGQYNDERERAMQLLNTNIQLYQKAQDRAYEEEQQLKEFQRQVALQNYGMVTDYMNTLEDRAYKEQRYEYEMAKELEQAQKKMDLQLQYEYGDLNSDNPMLVQQAIRRSIQGMYDTYSSLVPGLENPEISYEKVMQKIANGMSPAQALQERHDEIKNSKRLQNALANEQNKLNYDNWKMNEAMNPTSYSGYSGDSGYSGGVTNGDVTINYGVSEGSGTNGALKITTADGYGQMCTPTGDATANAVWGGKFVINQNTGYQCGGFARRRAGLNETPGGNSLAERKKMFDQETPVAGGLVLFTDGYDSTYGHIAYVREVRSDGTMVIEESNLKGDGSNKYTERVINQNAPGVWGFYNNTPAAKNTYEKIVQQAQQSQSGQSSSNNGLALTAGMTDEEVDYWFNQNPENTIKLFNVVKGLGGNPSDNDVNITKRNILNFPEDDVAKLLKRVKFGSENVDNPLFQKYSSDFINLGYTNDDVIFLNENISNGDTKAIQNKIIQKINSKMQNMEDGNATEFARDMRNYENLMNLINKHRDEISLVDGTINDIFGKIQDTGDYQTIKTLLSQLNAGTRRYYGGTAVSESELSELAPFIGGKTTWNVENLLSLLNVIVKAKQMGFYTTIDSFNIGRDDVNNWLFGNSIPQMVDINIENPYYYSTENSPYRTSSTSSSSSGEKKFTVTGYDGKEIQLTRNK